MLDKIISKRFKASTVIEAIVAALILLLSFSAGIVIYNKIILSSRSSASLGASYCEKALADSLVKGQRIYSEVIYKDGRIYNIKLKDCKVSQVMQVLEIITTDQSGKKLAELHRIIPISHE